MNDGKVPTPRPLAHINTVYSITNHGKNTGQTPIKMPYPISCEQKNIWAKKPALLTCTNYIND